MRLTTSDNPTLGRLGIALVVALAGLSLGWLAEPAEAAALTNADIVFVVDESGAPTDVSFPWVIDAAAALESAFAANGYTSVQFGLVGFGSFPTHYPGGTSYHHAQYDVGGVGVPFGTAAQFANVFGSGTLVQAGVDEDGYLGIEEGVKLFARENTTRLVVLVTDELRTPLTDPDHATPLTYAAVLSQLNAAGAYLNVFVDEPFVGPEGQAALGVANDPASNDAEGGEKTAYLPDGSAVVGGDIADDSVQAYSDYVQLAWATGGAAFDIDATASMDAEVVAAVTAALVSAKLAEAMNDNPDPPPTDPPAQVPAPGALWAGLMLVLFTWRYGPATARHPHRA